MPNRGKNKAQLFLALTLVAIVGVAYGFTKIVRMEMLPVAAGTVAPDFTAMTIDATPKPRSLHDYKGQVVLVNIWATWCGPCVIEMPSIQDLYNSYEKRGLKVVAVSVDDASSTENVREFIKSKGFTFDVLQDATGTIQETYETTGVPETLVIGKDGVIRKKMVGAVNWNSSANRALIEGLILE